MRVPDRGVHALRGIMDSLRPPVEIAMSASLARNLVLKITPVNRIGDAIFDLLGDVPVTSLQVQRDPHQHARMVANAAARRAALTAGGLALPPGPLGWVTLLPELVAVWRLQAQMVADIAGTFGRQATLSREQMVYCLFRHTAAQAMRDLLARVGGRYLLQQVPLQTLQRIARAVGISISRRALGRGVSRWVPVVGAIGVGAYAWFDTRQVAETAIALFGADDPSVLPGLPGPQA
jgi:hypothetical protein